MLPAQVDTVYVDADYAGDICLGAAAGNEVAAGSQQYPPKKDAPPKLLHNIRGIIFDFDGTLFDNALIAFYVIAACPLDVLRIWKERLVRKHFTGCDFPSSEDYFQAFFAAMGKLCLRPPHKMRDWYFNRYMPRMVRVVKKHYKPRPRAEELFRRFNPDLLKIAVYSDYPFVKERLEALGLQAHPEILLYDPGYFGAQKPAVRPFLHIAGDMGLAPEEILVIGDRKETDGYGAFNAGMHFFCLETGRKRYFRLDPNRRRPEEEAQGPSLVMYAGVWDDLIKLLLSKFTS